MRLEFIKDIFGNNYIGINIEAHVPDKNGLTLNDVLEVANYNITDFEIANKKLLERNHGNYHITVFSTMEYGKNSNTDDVVGSKIGDIIYKGIGQIKKDDKSTYFVVVECPVLNTIRNAHGFENKDLHVTIGFTHKDLFHDRKNVCDIYEFGNELYDK